jgi:ParB family transcriptional regulator, chromosome partitioning protein
MTTPPRGLGRGLGALIPPSSAGAATATTEGAAPGVLEVPVADITPNPRQPRTVMDTTALAELAASIREHGLIQPLIVTRARATDRVPYQLIAGERRWRAAQMAGLTAVPVLVKEATPQQSLELALVENIQRADLNPLEEAEAFQALISDFSLSQQEVADRVGKSRVAVANVVRLLRLPAKVKALLAQGALTEGHARALLGLEEDAQIIRAAEQVVARGLNVRETEDLVRRLLALAQAAPSTHEDPLKDADPDALHTRQLETAFRTALGTKVALSRGRRGGKLVIAFFSDEELQTIYERIVGGEL